MFGLNQTGHEVERLQHQFLKNQTRRKNKKKEFKFPTAVDFKALSQAVRLTLNDTNNTVADNFIGGQYHWNPGQVIGRIIAQDSLLDER